MKSIFLWEARNVCKGDPVAIAELIAAAGFERVDVKAADGTHHFKDWLGNEICTPALVSALHAHGLRVFGWGFNYGWGDGSNPKGEGLVAAEQVRLLGLDGWIFDVEGEITVKDPVGAAQQIIGNFRDKQPDVPAGFCYFSILHNPQAPHFWEWHNQAIIPIFMAGCNFAAPMVYWDLLLSGIPTNPVVTYANQVLAAEGWLTESVKQWRAATDKPLQPVGRAYDHQATPSAVLAFEQTNRALGCQGINWWDLDLAWNNAALWPALTSIPKYGAPPRKFDDLDPAGKFAVLKRTAQKSGEIDAAGNVIGG